MSSTSWTRCAKASPRLERHRRRKSRPRPRRKRRPRSARLASVRRLYEPCFPTRGAVVPPGKDWLHEIKHDGYRLIIQREGKRVRLFTRNGYDWTGRFPLITETPCATPTRPS